MSGGSEFITGWDGEWDECRVAHHIFRLVVLISSLRICRILFLSRLKNYIRTPVSRNHFANLVLLVFFPKVEF